MRNGAKKGMTIQWWIEQRNVKKIIKRLLTCKGYVHATLVEDEHRQSMYLNGKKVYSLKVR